MPWVWAWFPHGRRESIDSHRLHYDWTNEMFLFGLVLSSFFYRAKHAFSETLTKPCSGMPRVSINPHWKLDSLVTENWWSIPLEYVTEYRSLLFPTRWCSDGPTASPLLCWIGLCFVSKRAQGSTVYGFILPSELHTPPGKALPHSLCHLLCCGPTPSWSHCTRDRASHKCTRARKDSPDVCHLCLSFLYLFLRLLFRNTPMSPGPSPQQWEQSAYLTILDFGGDAVS